MADNEKTAPLIDETELTAPMRRSEKYVTLYTNQVEIGYSPWDMQFSFMQVHGRTADLSGEELATVTMSPQHAKALFFPYLKALIQYEEEHGVIQLPNKQPPLPIWVMLKNAIAQTEQKAREFAEQQAKESGEQKAE